MKIIKYTLLLYISIALFSTITLSQKKIDSLLQILPNMKDVAKATILNEISKEYSSKDFEKSLKYANEALSISKINKYEVGVADALHSIGNYYKNKSNNDKALEYYTKALNIRIKINDTIGIPRTYNALGDIYYYRDKNEEALIKYNNALIKYENAAELYDINNKKKVKQIKKSIAITLLKIGNVYKKVSNYENAVVYYQKALKIFELIDDKSGIAYCANNIGLVYTNVTYLDDTIRLVKALEYLQKALTINKELKNKVEIANSNNNIGLIYIQLAEIFFKKREAINDNNYDKFNYYNHKINFNSQKAIELSEISLKIRIELGDIAGQASNFNNIGTAYSFIQNYNKAIEYYMKSLEINEKHNIKKEIATNCFYIGQGYYYLKQYNKAIDYFNRSLIIASEVKAMIVKDENFKYLSFVYDSLRNYKSAYLYYKAYSQLKDTVYKESSDKIIQELNTKYETEKKEQQNNLLTKDVALKQNQIKQQNILIIVFIFIFIIIILFSILLYKQYNAKKRANYELVIKNDLITLQKQEITDSIHYAKRIQSAVLPHDEQVGRFIKEHFIMFKPKDIVSGDFYWIRNFEKANICIVAAADCTGHGVPGAFMSLLGSTFLNEIVNEYSFNPEKEIKSNEILNKLRNYVIKSLHQTGKIGEQKDGLDIALCVINSSKKIVDFSGANNPLYIIRDNVLTEIKADKMPIGIHDRADESFKNHIFEYKDNDRFYIFSDGFSDQFGGDKGKKYLSKNFKNFLISINNKPMDEQFLLLDNESTSWRSNIEQIDDQIVIGFKL